AGIAPEFYFVAVAGLIIGNANGFERRTPNFKLDLDAIPQMMLRGLGEYGVGTTTIGEAQERPGPIAGRHPAAQHIGIGRDEIAHILLLKIGLIVLLRRIENPGIRATGT